MLRISICLAMTLPALAACDAATSPSADALVLSDAGYRYASDACHLAGESALTAAYLDDSADLVACPKDITLIGNIEGAQEVLVTETHRLFSIPRR